MSRSLIAASLSLVAAAVLAPTFSGTARAAEPAAFACTDNSVLNSITHRFRYRVSHVPGLPQVDIVRFENIRETSYPSVMSVWGGSAVPRQYCHATAVLSDGHKRGVWYLIEGGMGFASVGRNIESCVGGFDPWHVYDAYCRVLR